MENNTIEEWRRSILSEQDPEQLRVIALKLLTQRVKPFGVRLLEKSRCCIFVDCRYFSRQRQCPDAILISAMAWGAVIKQMDISRVEKMALSICDAPQRKYSKPVGMPGSINEAIVWMLDTIAHSTGSCIKYDPSIAVLMHAWVQLLEQVTTAQLWKAVEADPYLRKRVKEKMQQALHHGEQS